MRVDDRTVRHVTASFPMARRHGGACRPWAMSPRYHGLGARHKYSFEGTSSRVYATDAMRTELRALASQKTCGLWCIRTLDYPMHYVVDAGALAEPGGYNRLPLQARLRPLEQSCRLFIAEAAVTPPMRTWYYDDWQGVTAARVVSFLTHQAVHHLF